MWGNSVQPGVMRDPVELDVWGGPVKPGVWGGLVEPGAMRDPVEMRDWEEPEV